MHQLVVHRQRRSRYAKGLETQVLAETDCGELPNGRVADRREEPGWVAAGA
jgi:hypothetical protein